MAFYSCSADGYHLSPIVSKLQAHFQWSEMDEVQFRPLRAFASESDMVKKFLDSDLLRGLLKIFAYFLLFLKSFDLFVLT
jgi:hypothetical protein